MQRNTQTNDDVTFLFGDMEQVLTSHDVILELLIGIQKFSLTVILLLLQGADLPAKELDSLLQLLGERKRKLEQEEADSNMEILLDFLHRVWQRKQDELHEVNFGFEDLFSNVYLRGHSWRDFYSEH